MDEKTECNIRALRTLISEAPSKSVVFFGGAGVSTESGIPDFRSSDGLYSLSYDVAPETMISRSYFDAHPTEFFRFYFERMVAPTAHPNRAHLKLAELERTGILRSVITQNIDGLHQAAGSRVVRELHGSILCNHCMACGAAYSLSDVLEQHRCASDGVPSCPACGGIVKPDVVLYEEALDDRTIEEALRDVRQANTLIIAGTSLVVHPAAGLVDYFSGDNLVIANLSPTPRDRLANLCIRAPIGRVMDF